MSNHLEVLTALHGLVMAALKVALFFFACASLLRSHRATEKDEQRHYQLLGLVILLMVAS